MSDWRSRALIGVTMVVIAPLSARLASTAAPDKKPGSAPLAQAVGDTTNPAGPVDLTNPMKARAVAAEESRLEFRRTLCGFLKLYANVQDTVNPSQRRSALHRQHRRAQALGGPRRRRHPHRWHQSQAVPSRRGSVAQPAHRSSDILP